MQPSILLPPGTRITIGGLYGSATPTGTRCLSGPHISYFVRETLYCSAGPGGAWDASDPNGFLVLTVAAGMIVPNSRPTVVSFQLVNLLLQFYL